MSVSWRNMAYPALIHTHRKAKRKKLCSILRSFCVVYEHLRWQLRHWYGAKIFAGDSNSYIAKLGGLQRR